MKRVNFFLISLSFLLSLFQLSVFSTWQIWGLSPQVWLVAIFWAKPFLPGPYAPAFIFFYFLFYDLLVGRPWPFTTGLIFILAVEATSKIGSRFMGGRILPPTFLFLCLNLLGFWYLRLPLRFDLFFEGLLVNLIFCLPFLPVFFFLRLIILGRPQEQLSLKLK